MLLAMALVTASLTGPTAPVDETLRVPRAWAQERACVSMSPEVCWPGPFFDGKTWGGCLKALLYAETIPRAEIALCREERASMTATTLRVLLDEVLTPEYRAAFWRPSESAVCFPNGSIIRVFGLDKPGRILGSRFGLIVVDQAEQLTKEQFDHISSRAGQTGMPFCQTLLLCNPESPDHWIYKRYRPDLGARVDGPLEVVLSAGEIERLFASPEYVARLDAMEGAFYERYRLGRWVAYEGTVFSRVWDPGRHIVDRPASWAVWAGYPPPDWPRHRGLDFGYQNPFACLWFAEDRDGRWWLYRQLYESGKIVEDHARTIREAEAREVAELQAAAKRLGRQDLEEQIARFNLADAIADPSGADEIATLRKHGVWCRPGNNDVAAGIQTQMSRLNPRQPGGPKLFIVRGSLMHQDPELLKRKVPTCLEEEIPGYRWAEPGRGGLDGAPKDQPLKRDDHALSAWRYLDHTLSLRTRARIMT